MLGVNASVQACYSRVAELKTERSAEYCFCLDYVAGTFDAEAAKLMNFPQNEFNRLAEVFARSEASLRALGWDNRRVRATISEWTTMANTLAQDSSTYEDLYE